MNKAPNEYSTLRDTQIAVNVDNIDQTMSNELMESEDDVSMSAKDHSGIPEYMRKNKEPELEEPDLMLEEGQGYRNEVLDLYD